MARYPKGPGSTMLNMQLKREAPLKAFPYLLKTGVAFKDCTDEGMPTQAMFSTLYIIADSVKSVLAGRSTIPAGTFTYQCSRYDYYYVKDTVGIREQLNAMYAKSFPGYEPLVMLREDKDWEAYLQFLYPNDETLEYMSNQKVVAKLIEAGDQLQQARQTDHWIYFATEKDRECFIAYAQKNGFKIEGKEKVGNVLQPYKLQISRADKVDLVSISKLTIVLRKEASKCGGQYDGWETFVIK